MKDTNSIFGLNDKQTQILFSLQRLITANDWGNERRRKIIYHKDYKQGKIDWLLKWDKHINSYMHSIGCNFSVCIDKNKLTSLVKEIDSESETNIWKYIILLECVIYTPYYPFGDNKEENKAYKNLSIDKNNKEETLDEICSILAIDHKYIKVFRKSYAKSKKSLSEFWKKIAISSVIGAVIALTAILTFQYELVALIPATAGLSGAAAMSAGLAALGGGAIATGGAGIAGGMTVLIGGGSLLGAGAGAAVGLSVASLGSDVVMLEAAKMQVVLMEIVLAIQKDTKAFQDILFDITKQNNMFRAEIITLKAEGDTNKEKIKDLEKSISYLEKLINNTKL